MRSFIVFVAILAIASAVPVPTETEGLLTTALKFVKECGDKPMTLCLKERALHYVDQTNGNLEIAEGIQFIQTEQPAQGRSMNDISLPVEPEARENEIDALLVDRVARFLGTHTLQFKVSKDSIQDMQRSLVDEGRGKKKKIKKLLMPLLMIAKLKAAAILPLIIGFIALIAVKAFVISKLALLLAGFLGLKKLLGSKDKHETHEITHASFDDHHGHYGHGFDGHNLAYSGHV